MEILSQIVKLIYRRRYWLILLPVLSALYAIYSTRNMSKEYLVNTTIYTGIASGFTIESGIEGGRVDWSAVNNGIDNLISVIMSKSTLRNVSMRLYAQHMIYGDTIADNNYIQANNYKALLRITPREVLDLIDKTSEEKTIENLNAYEKSSPKNFVYGLFNWYHRHYSYSALSKIEVKRILDSDMLQIQYKSDDPGVAYNTLVLLNAEFVKQYELLRFGQTNNVIEYFRNELAILTKKLRDSEDSLTRYNVEKKIINYSEQTKQVAVLAYDFDLQHSSILLEYSSSNAAVDNLEQKISDQVKTIQNNAEFVDKLNLISKLSDQITRIDAIKADTLSPYPPIYEEYKTQLAKTENDLKALSKKLTENKYTKEGIAATSLVDKWVNELLIREKSLAQMKVMEEIQKSLDSRYTYFSPIGSTLKRKERDINFTEQSYLSILASLNAALMRQKTLQMTSATLKAIDPPLFPITPTSKRKTYVLIVFFATLAFVTGYFIILEILDRTVRDKERAERLIPATVLGAFPKKNKILYRRYNNIYERIATNALANTIVPYLRPQEGPDIINFISTDEGTGKSKLIELLSDYWSERGLKIKVISWHDEGAIDSREYILSKNLTDFYDYENEDIILVEHRSILKSAIPVGLLKEASINIVVVRSDKVWRDIDKIAFERLQKQANNTPVLLYLTRVFRNDAEKFMGLLPPHTHFRKFVYKIIQFGLTSK